MKKPNFRVIRFVVRAGAGWARNKVRKCARRLTGREVLFREVMSDERSLFLRQYILHVTGIRPIRMMTSVWRGVHEGPGSQALMAMCAMNFARSNGFTYVHTPFVTVHGADRPTEEWVRMWEDLFNLGAGEVPCTAPRHKVVNYCHILVDIERCFGWEGRTNELARNCIAMIPELRQKYYRGKKPRTTREITVAINIRRGEVSASQFPHIFTANEVVLQTARNVKTVLDASGAPYRINLYTNGDDSEFEAFSEVGAHIFTNPAVDPVWTMQELIEADVLIMGKSSFSFYAGLISDGIKIFDPPTGPRTWSWWDRFPIDDWIPCRPDGSIDAASFAQQLDTLIRLKRQVAPL